jgi:hypothetical protein
MRDAWLNRTIAAAAAALVGSLFVAPAHAQNESPATENAQPAQEPDEEIVIRGRRTLFTLRKEMEAARERVWAVFNDINSDDDFDISCNDRDRTGTRMTKQVCRPEYANRATAQAGKELARRIQGCPPNSPNYEACLAAALETGNSEAQQYIARIAYMDQRLDDEFRRLVRERRELATAINEFLAKENEYKGNGTVSREVSASVGELPYGAQRLFEVIMGHNPWQHPLTQRTFTIANVFGEVRKLELECAEGRERLDYAIGVDWTLPTGRNDCILQVSAREGTTFRLYEF